MSVTSTGIVKASYPGDNVLNLAIEDDLFDFIFSDQVSGYVEGNPQRAIDDYLRILKPSGITVHETCLINSIHLVPKDFWCFTPDALRHLFTNCSSIIEADG